MTDADEVLIEVLLDDILDKDIVADAVDHALGLLRDVRSDDQSDRAERELASVKREHARLIAAVTNGEQVSGLLEALRALDRRRRDLETEHAAIASRRPIS